MGKRLLGNPRFRMRSRTALAREVTQLRRDLEFALQRIRRIERQSEVTYSQELTAPEAPIPRIGDLRLESQRTQLDIPDKAQLPNFKFDVTGLYTRLREIGFSPINEAGAIFTLRLLVDEGFSQPEIESCAHQVVARGANTVRFLAAFIRAQHRDDQVAFAHAARLRATRFQLEEKPDVD